MPHDPVLDVEATWNHDLMGHQNILVKVFGNIIPKTFAYKLVYGFLTHDGLKTYLVNYE